MWNVIDMLIECDGCNWNQIYIGIIINVSLTMFIAFLFKFIIRPKIEKNYEKDSKIIRIQMIIHLINASYYMGRLFEELEKTDLDVSKNSSVVILLDQSQQISWHKNSINDIWRKLQILYDSSSSIMSDEYMAIQKYVTAIHTIILPSKDVENYIFFDSKALEFVWYYAKIIIKLIDKKELGKFYVIWNNNFNKKGGIDKIKKPQSEVGDIFSVHHNLNDELFYFDSKYSNLLAEFKNILNEIKSIKEELQKRDDQ